VTYLYQIFSFYKILHTNEEFSLDENVIKTVQNNNFVNLEQEKQENYDQFKAPLILK
jgi:hypothetical protein